MATLMQFALLGNGRAEYASKERTTTQETIYFATN